MGRAEEICECEEIIKSHRARINDAEWTLKWAPKQIELLQQKIAELREWL